MGPNFLHSARWLYNLNALRDTFIYIFLRDTLIYILLCIDIPLPGTGGGGGG